MSVCILNSARAEILIDSKDYDRVSQFTWTVRNERGRRYVVRTTRENRTIRLHRFINETPDGLDTDHINGNGLDNRRSNLRAATRSQNNANQRARSGTSPLKGVYRHYNSGVKQWRAAIRIDGRRKYLGLFRTPEEAHTAYCVAARVLFGHFARFE